MIRRTKRKDPALIGKLSNKRLDLSFSLPKEGLEKNVSAVLPNVSRTNRKLIAFQSQGQFINKDRKPSIMSAFEPQSESPLPQIRVSFSKIYQLRKVCEKNPEEDVELQYNGLLHSRKQHLNRFGHKDSPIVGQLYSPRAKSVNQPGFIRHQNARKSRKSLQKNTRSSRFKNYEEHLDTNYLKNSRKIKVKVIQHDRKFINESQDLLQSKQFLVPQVNPTREEGTQSRVLPIQPVCMVQKIQPQVPVVRKVIVTLKDEGQFGYVQVNEDQDHQVNHPNELKILWEQNYLEANNSDLFKNSFFLEEQKRGKDILKINFDISLSEMKIMLIQQSTNIKVAFNFPDILLNTITDAISQPEVHQYAQKIFGVMRSSMNTQLISFKKFSNCILVTTKVPKSDRSKTKADKCAILWYFSGKFYAGGWNGEYGSQSQGSKMGMGLEYYPSNYIYYGSFSKNAKNGFGIMKKATKEVYLGEFANSKRQGWGKVFDSTGQIVYDGNFEDGRFLESRSIAQ